MRAFIDILKPCISLLEPMETTKYNLPPMVLWMLREYEETWKKPRTLANLAYNAILRDCIQTEYSVNDLRVSDHTIQRNQLS